MVKEIDHPACGLIKLVGSPVKYSHATPGIRTPPPTLGQHTDEVLGGLLEFGKHDIAQLKKDGVVA
jgi:succinate--hydroxymethylglutarate CoA-transferase